jgi:CheY-like chemotaxis protein
VLEACRGRPAGPKVVVLSNNATADKRKRCTQLGADAVFDKSNEIDALLEYCIGQSENPRPGA